MYIQRKGRNSPTFPSTLFISPHTLLLQTVLFYHHHMYGTFTHPEFFRSLPHSRLMFNDIICDLYCPFLNIIFHTKPLHSLFLQCMQGWVAICGLCLFLFHPVCSSFLTHSGAIISVSLRMDFPLLFLCQITITF